MSSRAKRFSTKENAEIEVYGQGSYLTAFLKNLSKTGARFEVSEGGFLPKKGDLLNLTVKLDKIKKTHNLAAQVVWTQGQAMGVCFVSREEVFERMMAKGF